MIYILIIVCFALVFALGALTADILKKRGKAEPKQKKLTDFNSEIINFLNYDGSEQ